MGEANDNPERVRQVSGTSALRAGLWLAVAILAGIFFLDSSPWAFRAAAFASIYSIVVAALSPRTEGLGAHLFHLCVDASCATLVAGLTGGPVSPFCPLLFLAALEAQYLLGPSGILVGPACAGIALALSGGAAVSTWLAGSVLIVAIAAQGLLLHLAGLAKERSETLLPERTVDSVEKLLEAAEEQNRQLRARQVEMSATLRTAQWGTEGASTRYRLLSAAMEANDLESAHIAVLDVLKDCFDAGAGAIWALDYRGERLELRAAFGPVSPIISQNPLAITPTSQPSEIRKRCEQKLRASVPEPPRARQEGEADVTDNASPRPDVIGAALRTGDRIVGAVCLATARTGRFDPEEPSRLQALAVAIGLAVSNIEQRMTLHRSIREIAILHDMNLLLQTSTELEAIYDQIVDLVGRAVAFENCSLFRFAPEENTLKPVATRGRVVNLIDHLPFEHGAGISAWVAGNRKQLFIPDITQEPELLHAEVLPPRVRSFISVPLAIRENLIGVINVSHSQPNAFTQEDARVLTLLAGQAAMTIEREEMVRELGQLAITDGLTGVYNHRYFRMRLDNEIKRGARYGTPFSLVMIDLDHFKRINDRYGHGVGDLTLMEVAATLKRSVRETDITSRYGGEEFAIILTQTALNDALLTAERLRRAVSERNIEAPDGTTLRATVSIGVAAYPDHGESREAVLREADRALYSAKEAGRDCVRGA